MTLIFPLGVLIVAAIRLGHSFDSIHGSPASSWTDIGLIVASLGAMYFQLANGAV